MTQPSRALAHDSRMTKTREELSIALDKLEAKLPAMIAEYQAADLMDAFAREAELIERGAALVDSDYIRGRLNSMLRDAGLVPGDEGPRR